MDPSPHGTITRWLHAWRSAPSTRVALRYWLEYAALRTWSLVIAWFPVRTNLFTARVLGNVWWRLMKRHRERAMANLRPALGDQYSETALRRIAQRSFEHFAQLYLVELMLTPRLITQWSWSRHVELGELSEAIRILLDRSGALMITPHFGNYELLGYTMCRLGLPVTAIMRPPDNPLLDAMLVESRKAGGLELLNKKGATARAGRIIADGGALAFIGDQDAGRKCVFADFFGRPAAWYKSIALLAMRHEIPIIVGAAARTRTGYHYRIELERIIRPNEWSACEDPMQWITEAFAAALEAAIRRHPEQYLWMHKRWKTQPKPARGISARSEPRP